MIMAFYFFIKANILLSIFLYYISSSLDRTVSGEIAGILEAANFNSVARCPIQSLGFLFCVP